ncbi:MAG: 16S rRNA (uracil(1498)-N(3))-methyltransferase, partial [Nitrospirae bacterium]|nr:16S rRNA (uracil(1498)-N(3))-methyltransferase [Nitrospirota bacterium]
MPVYFIHSRQILNNRISLTGDLAHHLRDVLRLKVGDEIDLVDDRRRKFRSRIVAGEKRILTADIIEELSPPDSPTISLHLAQGLPKGDKMESIIQKCTELGVDRITPLMTDRCMIHWKSERTARIDRWRKIALEASQQAGRWTVPSVGSPMSLAEFLNQPKSWDLGILLWEEERSQRLKPFLDRWIQDRRKQDEPFSCLTLIGPEGGFSGEEAALAREKGLISVTLGERILRTETAGPSILAILQYAIG